MSSPEKSLKMRFVSGAFWSLAANATNRGLLLLAGVVIARFHGKVVFGEFGIVQSTIGMFVVLSTYAMGLTTTKYVAELRVEDPERASRIIGMATVFSCSVGLLLASAFACAVPWLAADVLAAPHLRLHLWLSAVLVPFGALNGAWNGALSGAEAFRALSMANFAAALLSFPIMVAGTIYWGLAGAVGGLVASSVFECTFKFFAARTSLPRHGLKIRLAGWRQELSVLRTFSLPSLLHGIIPILVNWLTYALLVNHGPGGYAELGVYNATLQWRMAILYIPLTLAGVTIALLAHTRNNIVQNRSMFHVNLAVNGGVSLCAAIGVGLCAKWIMQAYGVSFVSSTDVLILAAMTTVPAALSNALGYHLTSQGKVWPLVACNLVWAVILILIFVGFTERSAWGLAVANMVAYGSLVVLLYLYQRQRSARDVDATSSRQV